MIKGGITEQIQQQIKPEKEFTYWTPERKKEFGISEFMIGGSYADDPKKFIKVSEVPKGTLPQEPGAPSRLDRINALVTKYPDAFPLVRDKQGNSRIGNINFDKITNQRDKDFITTLMFESQVSRFSPSAGLWDMITKRQGN